ncbi:hypothetical protein [Streptomyces sp. BA2]|nr:hypothetical protein [Streptomyces sp. BA2]
MAYPEASGERVDTKSERWCELIYDVRGLRLDCKSCTLTRKKPR